MEYNLHNSSCLRFEAWCAWALQKMGVMVILIRMMILGLLFSLRHTR